MDRHYITSINVVIWNCKSIKNKIFELYNFISKYNIKILILSETWLHPGIKLSIPNFKIYRADRLNREGGGVAIAIHKLLPHQQLPKVNTELIENLFIQIKFNNTFVRLGSVYCPPDIKLNTFNNDINKLFSRPTPFIVGGDLNCKHQSWNNPKNTCRGNKLLANSFTNHFKINFSQTPTCFPGRGNPSNIDLLITKNFNKFSNLKTINDLSSDHLPVTFQLNCNIRTNYLPKRLDYKRANWKSFVDEINNNINLNTTTISSEHEIDSQIEKLNSTIRSAIIKSVPSVKVTSFKYPFSL